MSSVANNNNVQDKLTFDEIKQSYAKTDQTIISTDEYKNYVLVESRIGNHPTFFNLYNLETGEKDFVTDTEYDIDSEKTRVVNEDYIILYSDGSTHIYGYQSFPLEIHCIRTGKTDTSRGYFIPEQSEVRFPITQQISIKGKMNVKEEIIDVRVTVNGLQVCFGPQDSKDELYGADYVDSPAVDISYNDTGSEFTLNFKNTRFEKTYTNISSLAYSNLYIKSLELKEDDDSAAIIVKLNDSAKYYIGKKSEVDYDMQNSLGIPFMDIQFFNSNMEY